MSNFKNPGKNFGYINLPNNIDVLYPEDHEAICWSPSALIEREIFRSEVDVMIKLGQETFYFAKATELRVNQGMRFLRLDTSACKRDDFDWVVHHVMHMGRYPEPRPYLVSMHIDPLISSVHLSADTLLDDQQFEIDTVLNYIVITLLE